TPETVNHALSSEDMVATWPADTKEGWWRYRLKAWQYCRYTAAPLRQAQPASSCR
ncbi:insulinase family protein, partial [Salmonella enterica subsp. enterica serovar Muenchen]|nr:insulinase family protein [Salmonella enterica subsp. enterica serovar Muenchen]